MQREITDLYTSNLANATVAIRHRFTDTFNVRAGVEGEVGRSIDVLGRYDYGLVGLPVAASYDTTDRPLDPSRGVRVTATVTPYLGFGAAPDTFLISRIQASAYYAIDEQARTILAGRVAFGSILGGTLADIPASRRFYAGGGGGSVRGYEFKSLGPRDAFGNVTGGKSLFEASLEARIRITETLGVVPFFDMGQAYSGSLPDGSAPLRYAAASACATTPPSAPSASTSPCRCSAAPASGPMPSTSASDRPSDDDPDPHPLRPSPPRRAGDRRRAAAGADPPAGAGGPGRPRRLHLAHPVLAGSPTVAIGAVEGPLSSDAMIRNVTIADRDGVYLRIDTIRLVWRGWRCCRDGWRSRTSRSAGSTAAPTGGRSLCRPAAERWPLLPELPVKVEIGKFAIGEFVLGEPVLGVAARFTAAGTASLGRAAEGLNADVQVRRTDAPGLSAIKLGFVPSSQQLDLSVQHDEPAGGILARLANLPGLPPVKLDLAGTGRLDDWRGRIAFDAGPDINARGDAILSRDAQIRRLGLRLDARIENLLPPGVSTVFAGATKLEGRIVFGDDGGYAIEAFRLASDIAELTAAGYLTARNELNVTARGRALPNAGGATARGSARIERLIFDMSAMGALDAPRVEGKLDLAGLDGPGAKIGSMSA